MSSTAVDAVTFLFSAIDTPPDGFFQGYCFSDNDFVFGQAGAREFTAQKGSGILGGLDGCYVTVRQVGDEFHFDLDQSGYKLLFYFSETDFWVVSNSLSRIVGYLRDHGRGVAPSYAQLASFQARATPRLQMFSFQTVARGVRLAPRATTLVATPQGIRLQPNEPRPGAQSYAEGLRNHLHTWVSRMETLMADPDADFVIDVTGGVDSRTNVALAQAAAQRLGDSARLPRFACHRYASASADLAVAGTLADHYGFELNDSRPFDRNPLTPQESVDVFLALNAGVSSSLYLPVAGPTPYAISFSGIGGEIHRDFYELRKPITPEQFVAGHSLIPGREWLADDFARDALEALEDAPFPLRRHYREFRNRFHGGRSSRYQTTITPLDSVTAHLAQAQAGAERLDAGQFNYDVLASFSPALLDLPFDEPGKSPNERVRARLTIVDLPKEPNPGRLWAEAPQRRPVTTSSSRAEQMLILRDAVEHAAGHPFVRAFWDDETIDRAREVTDHLVQGTQVPEPDGRWVSALLAARLVAPDLPDEVARIIANRQAKARRIVVKESSAIDPNDVQPDPTGRARSIASRVRRKVSGRVPRA